MPTLTVPVLIRSREPLVTYDNLFQPLQIGTCTVPNRIARTAHSTGTSGEALIAYHEERARGGVGLAILEIAGVLPTSATHIPVFTDAVVDFYQEMARRLHAHGTKVFQQLWHGGAAYGRAGQPISASDIPTPSVNVIPRPMTKTMIDDVVAAFVAAARRCRDGGLDGIELHGAHGYLIHQFLSPATNLRDDEYGGSTENRARFLIEILEAVRAEVGDFPLGVRLSGTDFIEGGVDPAESARIAKLIEPLVDFVDVSMSSYWRFHKFLSTLDDPLGYEIETSEQVTRVVDVPTIVAGRIMTLDHASHLVESGVADMVSIVRGMIADPQLVVKARTGREAEIRPCIGTSMGCVANLMTTGQAAVRRQRGGGQRDHGAVRDPGPGSGDEEGARRRRRSRRSRGGPHRGAAGSRRGALRDGGVPRWSGAGGGAAPAPIGPRSDHPLPRRRGHAARREGPPPHAGRSRSGHRRPARRGHPRHRVHARRDGFQLSSPVTAGARRDPAARPHGLGGARLRGRATVGTTAVVYDDTGTFEAISAADVLLAAGAGVTIVSRFEQLGANITYPPATVEASRERLLGAGVRVRAGHGAAGDHADRGRGPRAWQRPRLLVPGRHRRHRHLPQPNAELGQHLREAGLSVHEAGNVTGTDTILAAIHSAAAITRQL